MLLKFTASSRHDVKDETIVKLCRAEERPRQVSIPLSFRGHCEDLTDLCSVQFNVVHKAKPALETTKTCSTRVLISEKDV